MTKKLVPTIAVACLLLAGCASTPNQTDRTARLVRLVGAAAELGTRAYLLNHPEKKPDFEAVRQALRGLVSTNNYDPAALAAALQKLPLKELRGPEGTLYVSAAILLWDEVIAEATIVNRQEIVAQVLVSLINGFDRALDPPKLPVP